VNQKLRAEVGSDWKSDRIRMVISFMFM